jgi:hypothetical protein
MPDGTVTTRRSRLMVAALAAIVLSLAGEPLPSAQGQALQPIWTRQANTPPPPIGPRTRGWMQIAYDEVNQKVVLIGGSGSTYYNDIWWYDGAQDVWSEVEPFVDCGGIVDFVPPAKRDEHVVAYDSENHLYWMFGGSGFGCVGPERTTGAGTTSLRIVDPGLPAVPPNHYKDWTVKALYTPSVGGTKVYVESYDPVTKTLTLAAPMGGLGPGMPYRLYTQREGGTWYYDSVARDWASLTGPHWGYTGPSPTNRLSPGFAYSSRDRAILMFGGGGLDPITDTWALDVVSKTWVRMLPANSPGSPPRLKQIENSMVYDASTTCSSSSAGCSAAPRPLTRGSTASRPTRGRSGPPR